MYTHIHIFYIHAQVILIHTYTCTNTHIKDPIKRKDYRRYYYEIWMKYQNKFVTHAKNNRIAIIEIFFVAYKLRISLFISKNGMRIFSIEKSYYYSVLSWQLQREKKMFDNIEWKLRIYLINFLFSIGFFAVNKIGCACLYPFIFFPIQNFTAGTLTVHIECKFFFCSTLKNARFVSVYMYHFLQTLYD